MSTLLSTSLPQVMSNMGNAMMGSGEADGEDRYENSKLVINSAHQRQLFLAHYDPQKQL